MYCSNGSLLSVTFTLRIEKMKGLSVGCILLVSFAVIAEEPKIQAKQSRDYLGETVVACGKVAQVSKGRKAHYLNIDESYPNETLSLLIWDENFPKFEQHHGDLSKLTLKNVCAKGKIVEYKQSLQIQMSNPEYLEVKN